MTLLANRVHVRSFLTSVQQIQKCQKILDAEVSSPKGQNDKWVFIRCIGPGKGDGH